MGDDYYAYRFFTVQVFLLLMYIFLADRAGGYGLGNTESRNQIVDWPVDQKKKKKKKTQNSGFMRRSSTEISILFSPVLISC